MTRLLLFSSFIFACLFAAAPASAQQQAQPAGGQNEAEARACIDALIREVPSYRALRELRDRMSSRGFRVVTKHQETYQFRGQPVFIYAVRVTGESEAYRIACTG